MIKFESKSAANSREQRNMHMEVRQAIGWGAAIRFKPHHMDPNVLLWYAAGVVIACIGWLFYIIFGALN